MSKYFGSGGRLDPETLARRLAEHLRSNPSATPRPAVLPRRELAAGLLRVLGIGSILVGIGLALIGAIPWVMGLSGEDPPVDDLPPSYSGQVPAIPPEVAPVVVTTEPTATTVITTATSSVPTANPPTSSTITPGTTTGTSTTPTTTTTTPATTTTPTTTPTTTTTTTLPTTTTTTQPFPTTTRPRPDPPDD